jgi:hypothetical protein
LPQLGRIDRPAEFTIIAEFATVAALNGGDDDFT